MEYTSIKTYKMLPLSVGYLLCLLHFSKAFKKESQHNALAGAPPAEAREQHLAKVGNERGPKQNCYLT